MKLHKIFSTAVYISFAWNIYLVGGVILGASYALDRAAGGQFDVFPLYLRIVYIFIFAVIVLQVLIFTRSLYGKEIKSVWILKAFVIIGALSIFANAASRSVNERWNIIPAFIIAIAFYRLLKLERKRSEISKKEFSS